VVNDYKNARDGKTKPDEWSVRRIAIYWLIFGLVVSLVEASLKGHSVAHNVGVIVGGTAAGAPFGFLIAKGGNALIR
jgi:hypothetical protein